jgi:hypothetical protein
MALHASSASSLAALGLAILAPSAGAVTVNDLILHYDFEHASDPTAAVPDVSGHGNNGKFVDLGNGGGPSTQAKYGSGAYQLSAVQTPDSFTLPSDAFSIAMWLKFPQAAVPNNIQMLACNSNGGFSTAGFRLYMNDFNTNNGRIVLETSDGTTGAGMAYLSASNYNDPNNPTAHPNPINDGTYHLLVFTYTQSDPNVGGAADAFTWYDNYYIANGGPFNGAMNPSFTKTGPIRFGGTLDNAFAPGGVQVDDVQIYHGVLSQGDMARLMNPPQLLPGDANADGTVNTADFTILANNFNASGRAFETGDFNGDGIVNALDFNLLASNFGQTNFTAAALDATLMPEPVALGALCVVGSLLRRRRVAR